MKRLLDLILCTFALLILLIPMLLVAIAVRLTSPGPILFWSMRVGKNNVLFLMPKFRTMQILSHLVLMIGLYLIFQTNSYLWLFLGIICFLWFGIVGVNVALHRYYSHKSFKTTILPGIS